MEETTLTAPAKSGVVMLATLVGLILFGLILIFLHSVTVGLAFIAPTLILLAVSRGLAARDSADEVVVE